MASPSPSPCTNTQLGSHSKHRIALAGPLKELESQVRPRLNEAHPKNSPLLPLEQLQMNIGQMKFYVNIFGGHGLLS